jgi:hypothetical protein
MPPNGGLKETFNIAIARDPQVIALRRRKVRCPYSPTRLGTEFWFKRGLSRCPFGHKVSSCTGWSISGTFRQMMPLICERVPWFLREVR